MSSDDKPKGTEPAAEAPRERFKKLLQGEGSGKGGLRKMIAERKQQGGASGGDKASGDVLPGNKLQMVKRLMEARKNAEAGGGAGLKGLKGGLGGALGGGGEGGAGGGMDRERLMKALRARQGKAIAGGTDTLDDRRERLRRFIASLQKE